MVTVGKSAFAKCTALTAVTLPASVEVIGDNAFYDCKRLKQLTLPESLRSIGNNAFHHCGINTLQLPLHLETLGDSAFFHCAHLTEVIIPPSVKSIGKWAFHGCNRMKVLEIAHDPQEIGEWIANKSTTFRCRKGSVVDKYCQKNSFKTAYI